MISKEKDSFSGIETITSIFMIFVIILVIVSVPIFYYVINNQLNDAQDYKNVLNQIKISVDSSSFFNEKDEQKILKLQSKRFRVKISINEPFGSNIGIKKYSFSLKKQNNIKFKDITIFKRFKIQN